MAEELMHSDRVLQHELKLKGESSMDVLKSLAQRHASELIEQGYTVIEGFLSPDGLAETEEALYGIVPRWEDYDPHAERQPPFALEFAQFPARIQFNVMRPDLIDFVENVTGTTDIRLSLSFLWFRYAGRLFAEQELHSDMMNNTLVFPRNDPPYRQVEGILYYTDVTADLSPTCVLPSSVDILRPGEAHTRPRSEYPHYYELEKKVEVPAGSMLLYNLTTFHRGGAFTATEGLRISHHFAFRSAAAEWAQWSGWGKEALSGEMATLLTQATPRQRRLLGFPNPGESYWTPEMIKAVAKRYPNMDLTPYERAM
jgi:hypothetical protein